MKNIFTLLFIIIITSTLLRVEYCKSQWLPQNSGTTRFLAGIYFVDANTGYVTGDSSMVLKTTNSGVNWFPLNTGTSYDNYFYDVYFFNANTGYICGGYFGGWDYGKIMFTTNGGTNWIEQYSGLNESLWSMAFTSSTTGYCVGFWGKILKTTNGGSNWEDLSFGTNTDLWSVVFTSSNTGYISGKWGRIYKTTNAGVNWLMQQTGASQRVGCLYFIDANTGYAVGDSGLMLKTTNAGVNWSSQSTFSNLGYDAVYFTSASTGYAVGNEWVNPSYIIKKTTNGGTNWLTLSTGVGNPLFDVFFINTNTGWITGYQGTLLKTTNGGVVAIEPISTNIPSEYKLYQNYPNPFNPSTKIKFDLPANVKSEKSNVKLIVYDILGKEIAVLVNEQLSSGTYEVNWNAVNYPSGIYFYRIETGRFLNTKKMILVR